MGVEAMRSVIVIVILATVVVWPLPAQIESAPTTPVSAEEIRELRQLVQELQAKVDRLEKAITSQPASPTAPNGPVEETAIPQTALRESSTPSSPATVIQTPKKSEPFAFADWTWLNGNPRTKTPAFDSPFFTPEIRADVDYVFDFRRPKDDTIGGSSEVFRSHEIQVTQL